MPPPAQRIFSANQSADVPLTAATEAVVATILGVTLPDPTLTVHISGFLTVTTAGGVTAATTRIRRNNLTGTVVGEVPILNAAATQTLTFPFAEDDQPGDVASLAYVVTINLTGGNGTLNHSYMQAIVG